jgi:hypothetical protein
MRTILLSCICFIILLLCFSNSSYLKSTYSQNNSVASIATSSNTTMTNSSKSSNASSVVGPLASPGDFPEGPGGFPSKSVDIAMELTSLSPAELLDYPITDLSANEITSAFKLLNPFNLAKVLLSINQKELVQIQNVMPSSNFNEIMDRLIYENRTQVQARLSSSHVDSIGKMR